MELLFGMPVVDRDGGEVGALDRVLVDPGKHQVTQIVVKPAAVSEDLLVPVSMVQGAGESGLVLRAGADELKNMPRYYEGRASSPPSGRIDTSVVREPAERRQQLEDALGVAADALELGPASEAAFQDVSGRLLGVTTDDYTNTVTQLRVRAPAGDLMVPATDLDRLGAVYRQRV